MTLPFKLAVALPFTRFPSPSRVNIPSESLLDCFEQEVALDPDYALAWAGLADSQTVLGYSGLARPEVTMPKAVEAARRAVTLAPSQAEAHNALAMASLMGVSDRAKAEQEFLRALQLNPRYVRRATGTPCLTCSGLKGEWRRAWRKPSSL